MSNNYKKSNPWKALTSYQENEGNIFYGREVESSELFNYIDDELVTTLYGCSGIGKSSLLKAGVFPLLRMEHYSPIMLRLSDYKSPDKTEHFYAKVIIESICSSDSYTTHCRLQQRPNDFWSFFHSSSFIDHLQEEVYPVIVLDQFEEILINHPKEAETLLSDLHSLISDNRRIDNLDIYKADTNFRFILSLREDDLCLLEDIIERNGLSLLKQHRYRLRALSKHIAKDIVLCVGHDYWENDGATIADAIVDYVSSLDQHSSNLQHAISPVNLSLVCYQIFESRRSEYITLEDVQLMQQQNPLKVYYKTAVKHLSTTERQYIEDHMVSEDGRRIPISISRFDQVVKHKTPLLPGGEYPLLVENAGCYEISHDMMAKAICDVKQEMKAEELHLKNIKQKQNLRRIGIAFTVAVIIYCFHILSTIVCTPWKISRVEHDDFSNSMNIFRTLKAQDGELHLMKDVNFEGIFNDPNLHTLRLGDGIKLQGRIIAPKLREVIFTGGQVTISNHTFANNPPSKITVLTDSLTSITFDWHGISTDQPIDFDIPNCEHLKVLYSDVLLSRHSQNDTWQIAFVGNTTPNDDIFLPDSIKLGFLDERYWTHIKRATAIDLDTWSNRNKEGHDSIPEYSLLTNNNPQNANIDINDNRIIFADLQYIKTIKRFFASAVKEAHFPHAKNVYNISAGDLRHLALPIVEHITADAISSPNLAELVLPTKLCIDRDTLQKNLIHWGITKHIKCITPLNQSVSLVRLSDVFNISTSCSEYSTDKTYNYCPYYKRTLRLPAQITDVRFQAFNGAANLEQLSVDFLNKKFIGFHNVIYRRGNVEPQAYAPNASKLFFMSWNPTCTMLLGENVEKVYIILPEAFIEKQAIKGDYLDRITLYVPKYKRDLLLPEIANQFKEVKTLNRYQVIYYYCAYLCKRLISEWIGGTILIILLLLLGICIKRSRRITLYIMVLYPIFFAFYVATIQALNLNKFNVALPAIIAGLIAYYLNRHQNKKQYNNP